MNLIKQAFGLYKSLRLRNYAETHPEEYAKSIGVNMKGRVYFHTTPVGMFGSEPWMITLGNDVHITSEVRFITHDGGTLPLRKEVPDLEITKPIVVGDDVFIGVRSLILPGVTIGNRSIIGAGSVVTCNVPAGEVWGGGTSPFYKNHRRLSGKD